MKNCKNIMINFNSSLVSSKFLNNSSSFDLSTEVVITFLTESIAILIDLSLISFTSFI